LQQDGKNIPVFVYGSLKTDLGNHVLLERSKAIFVGYDTITGPFTMISFRGFPGVIREPNTQAPIQPVMGELWMVDAGCLVSLDMLESHPNFYERFKYRTDVNDVDAWMYTLPASTVYMNRSVYPEVHPAIWRMNSTEHAFFNEQGIDLGDCAA